MLKIPDELAKKVFDTVAKDEGLVALIDRARNSKDRYPGGMILVLGYNKKLPKITNPPIFYYNRTEYEVNFNEQAREQFNGRIVAYEVPGGEYECITDIPDNAPKELHGRWMLAGYGPNEKGKRKFINQSFEHKDDLRIALHGLRKEIDEKAVVHQLGTTVYTIVETGVMLTAADDSVIIEQNT